MENKHYLVEFYGSHDVFARNEREARQKTLDWLERHSCFVSFDVQEFDAPPKEGSLAAIKMKENPLKRQHIHVHEDDMESTCPACGYMLYEEANMIFNYCPTCGQALNNNDFSEDINMCAEHIDYTPVPLKVLVEKGMLKAPDIHRETIDKAIDRKTKKTNKYADNSPVKVQTVEQLETIKKVLENK